jgi:O-antigen/teichoic acid export membrane protein
MFAQAVIAARLLGAEDYGIVTLLLAIAQIASAFALLGYGAFAMAEVARGLKRGHHAIARLLSVHGHGRILALSLIVMPLAYGCGAYLLGGLSWEIAVPLLITIPALASIQLLRGIALGLSRPFWGVAPGEVFRPGLLVAALIGAALFAEASSALFITLYMATALIAAAIAFPTIRQSKDSSRSTSSADSPLDKSQWDRGAIPFLGLHLVSILQIELATLMLGLLATPEDVGLFQPIARISMLLMLPLNAMGIAFSPRVSGLYAEGKTNQIKAIARVHTLTATGLLILGGLVIGLIAPYLLLLFGSEFTAAAPLVWFLVAGRVVQAACGPGMELLGMTGNTNRANSSIAMSIGAEAVLAFLLIPIYGLTGAAMAAGLGLALRGVLLAAASHSALNIGLAELWRPSPKHAPSA